MAKNIIPQGTTAAIAARVNKYEESQKQRIIEVCQSNMKYAYVLGFIEGEIKQSKKMASFKYTLLCWKPDGVYQLNRAINEVFGSAVSNPDDITGQYTKRVYCKISEAVRKELYANNDMQTLLAYFSRVTGFPNNTTGTWTYPVSTSGAFPYQGTFKNSISFY